MDKVSKAKEMITRIRNCDPKDLNKLIVDEAGEDVAQFFLAYSASLLAKDPDRFLENASSLMLMGYLIRSNEESEKLENVPCNRDLLN